MTILLILAAAGSPFLGLWVAGAVKERHPEASRLIIGVMQAAAVVLLVCAMAVKCSGPIDPGRLPADW